MWVFLNNAMLSAVEDRDDSNFLVVRARVEGDIERVFPNAYVMKTTTSDYLFRAWIKKTDFAEAMQREVMGINYDNFKNSVHENDRHDAYLDVWTAMWGLQYDRNPAAKQAKWGNYFAERYGDAEVIGTDGKVVYSGPKQAHTADPVNYSFDPDDLEWEDDEDYQNLPFDGYGESFAEDVSEVATDVVFSDAQIKYYQNRFGFNYEEVMTILKDAKNLNLIDAL